MTTNTQRFSSYSKRSQAIGSHENFPDTPRSSLDNSKNFKNGFPVLKTKQTTFTMPDVIRSILKGQRITNTPASSDSRYISNLIYRDRFGIDLYNEEGEQLFEIDPKTGEKIEH